MERGKPLLGVQVEAVAVRLKTLRQDAPPKLAKIVVESSESEAGLALLHRNLLKYGTISNTLSGGFDP